MGIVLLFSFLFLTSFFRAFFYAIMNFSILLGLLVLATIVSATPWRRQRHRDEKIMHADEALLNDEAIEDDGNDDLMPSGGGDKVNDKQKRDEEIGETMPYGGDDVTNDEQKVETRADDGKALGEQIVSSLDEKPAPSDKSFKLAI